MDAYDIYRELFYVWVKYFGIVIGFDISQNDYKPNILTWATTVLAFSAVLSGIYSFFVVDFQTGLEVAVVLFVAIQVVITKMCKPIPKKFMSILKYFLKAFAKCIFLLFAGNYISKMAQSVEKTYSDNKNAKNYDHLKLMRTWSSNTLLIAKILYPLYVACGVAFGLMPFILYPFTRKFELAMSLLLPIPSNVDNEMKLLITSIFHFFCSAAGCLSYGVTDVTYSILIINTRTLSTLIKFEWEKLNLRLECNAEKSEIEGRFRNLCMMHRELAE